MTTTETTLLRLRAEQIEQHPDNPRGELGDIADLADSIRVVGLLEPIVVVPAPDDLASKKYGRVEYLLIAGHRRLAACIAANVSEIPAIYRADLVTRAQQIEAMLVENLHRVDLSPIEEGNSYQLLIDITGLTQAKVAESVGQPARRVRDRLRLTKLPAGVQTRIAGGEVTLTEAAALADIAVEPDLLENVEKAIGSSDFRWRLENAQRTVAARERFRKEKAVIDGAGIPVLEEQPYSWRSDSTVAYLANRHADFGLGDDPTPEDIAARKDDIPGLAVFISGNRIDWYCDKAPEAEGVDRSIDDTDLPQTPEELEARAKEDAQRAAEARAREELEQNLDAAAAVRLEHVSGILHANGNEDIAKSLLITWLLDEGNEQGLDYTMRYSQWPMLAKLLRIAPEVDLDSRPALVRRKLEKLTLPALTILTATWWTYDEQLNRPGARTALAMYPDEPVVDWVHTLSDVLAYPWSDFERDHLGLDVDGHVVSAAEDGDAA